MAILIGDIGGTKASWCLASDAGESHFRTQGFNPFSHNESAIETMISAIRSEVITDEALEVFYYGAGASQDRWMNRIIDAFRSNFNIQHISVHTDLLGAARGLCGHKEGAVGILGTGSNFCWYDGTSIDRQINTLGWPLGDEGSGTYIGKLLVRALYYDQLSDQACAACYTFLPKDRLEFLAKFKQAPRQNQFLSEVVRHMKPYMYIPEFQLIMDNAFQTYLKVHVGDQYLNQKLNFIGSIAFYFCDELRSAVQSAGYELGEVLQDPLQGLISYHLTHN